MAKSGGRDSIFSPCCGINFFQVIGSLRMQLFYRVEANFKLTVRKHLDCLPKKLPDLTPRVELHEILTQVLTAVDMDCMCQFRRNGGIQTFAAVTNDCKRVGGAFSEGTFFEGAFFQGAFSQAAFFVD